MSLKDYNAGRNDGLAMALTIAERDGLAALRDEIHFRGVTNIHTSIAKKRAERGITENKRNDAGHNAGAGSSNPAR